MYAGAASQSVTLQQRDEAVRRLEVFKPWFSKTFDLNDSNVLFVLPIENFEPRYRDETVDKYVDQYSWGNSVDTFPGLQSHQSD